VLQSLTVVAAAVEVEVVVLVLVELAVAAGVVHPQPIMRLQEQQIQEAVVAVETTTIPMV